MRKLFLLLPGLLIWGVMFAQKQINCWTPLSSKTTSVPESQKQPILPNAYQLFSLQQDQLSKALAAAPMEFTDAAKSAPVELLLPTPTGKLLGFSIVSSPIMAPELAAKYPQIKTFAGYATDGSGATVRMGVGAQGFYAFVFELEGGAYTVRPFTTEANATTYMVYDQQELPATAYLPDGKMTCGQQDEESELELERQAALIKQKMAEERSLAPVRVKKYRIAIAAKAEYSNFISSTNNKTVILSEMVKALNFIVAIQERDLNVRLELVAKNDTLIFTDPNTDPYSGTLVSDWMNQNGLAINTRIGSGSYDIGHIFGKYVTGSAVGVANPGSTCDFFNKAKGSSSAPSPNAEYFYLVAAHEMCHQLNGRHTWSNCTADLTGQLNPPTAYEPGSGSTIMGYPGSCLTNDVQSNNDRYYHASSIAEVGLFVRSGGGSTCGSYIETTNNPPVVSIPLATGIIVPKSTPFQLTGEASDPDGDAVTYCWEQMDLGPTSTYGTPTGTAPSFRSYTPVTSPTRVFPRITTVLAGSASKSDVLPTYSRELNFRLTVRDNKANGGGVNSANIKINAAAEAGPFRVTPYNSTAVTWRVGEFQEVTWDVANTDKAPINCQKVNILLSLDGGTTNNFPIVLASQVPNSGRACIQVPSNTTGSGRIRVEAVDNIFFNVSLFRVTIAQPVQPGFNICTPLSIDQACFPTSYVANISTTKWLGFETPINLSVTGLPAGTNATFEPNPVAPGETAKLILSLDANTLEGTSTIKIKASAGALVDSTQSTLTFISNNFASLALQTPANGATNVGQSPTLSWNTAADASSYEVQVAENPSFEAASIKSSAANLTGGLFKVPVALEKAKRFFWRVRPINECGAGAWTDPFVFATPFEACTTLTAGDLPKQILTTINSVESKINFGGNGILSDVNVKQLKVTHTFFKNLEAKLVGPDGTEVALFGNNCGANSGNYTFGFDNSATTSVFPCPPPINGVLIRPTGSLDNFNGKNAGGEWTMRVTDNTAGSGGSLTGVQLELCFSTLIEAPLLVTNLPLKLNGSNNEQISASLLKAQDNSGPNQLTFTLLTTPKAGEVRKSGTALKVGDTFTQADVDNGSISYFASSSSASDYFKFMVSDPDGGFVAGTFVIETSVDAFEPKATIAFALSPNPATEAIRLDFKTALSADTRVALFNATGQLLRTWNLANGVQTTVLNIVDLPKGVYALSLENEQGKAAKKVVIE